MMCKGACGVEPFTILSGSNQCDAIRSYMLIASIDGSSDASLCTLYPGMRCLQLRGSAAPARSKAKSHHCGLAPFNPAAASLLKLRGARLKRLHKRPPQV